MSRGCWSCPTSDFRIVLCPAHAEPLSRMVMRSAAVVADACPWCKVQRRPRVREGDKAPDPIVFGPPVR